MPSKYLLFVNSRPLPDAGVDDDAWIKWYTNEHLPDLVNSKTTTRACFYRETHEHAFASRVEKGERNFLAIYQTDFEEPLKTKEYLEGVRHSSDLFPKRKENRENGEFDARNYKLIQDYDPDRRGESAPPSILTVEMQPVDEEDYDRWYREEHLDMLHKLPGYRRGARYVLGPHTGLMQVGDPPKYLAIHEMDSLAGFGGNPAAKAAGTTPWTVKQIEESKSFIPRGWELIHSEGF